MSVSQLKSSDGHFLFADVNKMVILFNLIIYIMALRYKWHSGSEGGVVNIDFPRTEKEKVRFAEDILDMIWYGWNITIFLDYSDNEEYVYDTAD